MGEVDGATLIARDAYARAVVREPIARWVECGMSKGPAQDEVEHSDLTEEDLAAIDAAIRDVREEMRRDPVGSARRLREWLASQNVSPKVALWFAEPEQRGLE